MDETTNAGCATDASEHTRERLQRIGTADAADFLSLLGVRQAAMLCIVAMGGSRVGTCVGRARTLRLLPYREDRQAMVTRRVNRDLYDSLRPGDALVVDAMGTNRAAALGDMMFARFEALAVAAVVVDGSVRDLATLRSGRVPVFARSSHPASFAGRLIPDEADCAVQCGGVLVIPGDWVLADDDGVIIVPDALAVGVADLAEAKRPKDAFSTALLKAGFPLDHAYPLPAGMSGALAEFHADGRLPKRPGGFGLDGDGDPAISEPDDGGRG